jgi:HK97 family phage prohead protease
MTTKIEKRTLTGVQVRAAAGEAFTLEGIAASYNMPSKPIPRDPSNPRAGTFTEYIAPGAFKRSLRSKADVKCLFNHSANVVLGRVKNGTLALTDTDTGLAFRVQLNQKMQSHQDLYASVKRGDISECSYAFNVAPNGQKWSADYSKRTITDVDLYDVSVVTDPAYAGGATSVDARQLRAAQYVVTQDLRSKHAAALARLAPVIAADKTALAEDRAHDEMFEAAMRDVRRWATE